jgi:predicted nuclease of predicted toxin-antitoxin system
MRFLVDENLPDDISNLLRHLGHDVVYLPETELRGAADRDVWRFAARESRVIVTRDLDFPLPDSPRPPGVILIRVPDGFTRRQIERVVSEYAAGGALDETTDAITVISPGRVRIRKL